MVKQYLENSIAILSSPRSEFKVNERRKLGRISLFGHSSREVHDLRQGFPLLTTKKMGFKTVAHELRWFLRGETNIKYLVDNDVHIWDGDAFNHNLQRMVEEGIFPKIFPKFSEDWEKGKEEYIQKIKEDGEFAHRWGRLGPVYGSQWIHWPKYVSMGVDDDGRQLYIKDSQGIDQIASTMQAMRKNMTSSRHIITAWNPEEVPQMALPPCHTMFHLNSNGEDLDLLLYQRSCDMFLGVPFNIASYAMLTTILAKELGLKPRHFIHVFGDLHFYAGAGERANWYQDNLPELKKRVWRASSASEYVYTLDWVNNKAPAEEKGREGEDHVTGILEQLAREPRALPKLSIANVPYGALGIEDFKLEDYNPHPAIKRKMTAG